MGTSQPGRSIECVYSLFTVSVGESTAVVSVSACPERNIEAELASALAVPLWNQVLLDQ